MRVVLVPAASIASQLDSIVTRLQDGGADVRLCEAAALCDAALDGVAVIAGPGALRCDTALFDRAPDLCGLVAIGSGCEGFDRTEAARRGIAIRRGATRENAAGMASAAVMLMLTLCHDLPAAQAAARAGTRRDIAQVRLLDDLAVGLIGYGAIGRDVARRLIAWNVHVRATSPSRRPGTVVDGVPFTSLDELLATSDVISLHAAYDPSLRQLLDRRRIALIKAGAILVNTARGGLVDEAALAAALRSGAVAGAALDCLEREPLPPDSPLRMAPNLILTPHQIGHTADGAAAGIAAFVDNILSFAEPARHAPQDDAR